MTTNYSGANYFIQQVRTFAEHTVDSSNASDSDRTQIQQMAHGPYKGYKQTKSSAKVLAAMEKQLQKDLKKVQGNFNTTQWIGTVIDSPTMGSMDLDDDFKKSYYQFNFQALKPQPSRTATNSPISSLSLASEIGVQQLQPQSTKLRIRLSNLKPASSDIKIRFRSRSASPTTTENNGITKNVAQKRPRIKFNLDPEDRLSRDQENKLRRLFNLPEFPEEPIIKPLTKPKFNNHRDYRPTSKANIKFQPTFWQRPKLTLKLRSGQRNQHQHKANLDPLDNMDIDRESSIDKENPATGAIAALEFNNKFYNSTRYYPITILKKETKEEKQKKDAEVAAERFIENIDRECGRAVTRNLEIRMPNCNYYHALQQEAKKPTMVTSEIIAIRQDLATREPRQRPDYNNAISTKAVSALEKAEKVVGLKSKIVSLIRTKEAHDEERGKNEPIEERQVLSAIPLHMRMSITSTHGTRADGRIEHGIEARWTAPCARLNSA